MAQEAVGSIQKFIAVVNAGEWGDLRRNSGDYDWLHSYLLQLFDAEEGKENAGKVKIVPSVEVALWTIHDHGLDAQGVLIFTTKGMIPEASKVKREHPDLRVVIITGLPEDVPPELVAIEKMDLYKKPSIRKIILG